MASSSVQSLPRSLIRKGLFSPTILRKNESNSFASRLVTSRWRNPSPSQLPSCVLATTTRTSSSSSSSAAPLRLRRPLRFSDPASKPPPYVRPHAITLFPGDFSDNADPMEDDESDGTESGNSTKRDDDPTARIVADLQRREREQQLQKERWLRNAMPPVRVPIIDARGRAYGRGGRKRAEARVWVQAGLGQVVVNRRPLDDYFARLSDRDLVLQPLVATETCGKFDVTAIVKGGGLTGQAGAIRHGLSRALNAYDPDRYRPTLKALGFLTRDARKVERKKVGHVKARKSPQWVRR